MLEYFCVNIIHIHTVQISMIIYSYCANIYYYILFTIIFGGMRITHYICYLMTKMSSKFTDPPFHSFISKISVYIMEKQQEGCNLIYLIYVWLSHLWGHLCHSYADLTVYNYFYYFLKLYIYIYIYIFTYYMFIHLLYLLRFLYLSIYILGIWVQ